MDEKKSIIAIIPARGGSKGLSRKNVRILNGKPLIYYTIEVALGTKPIDRVIVSTEDDEIANISRNYGAEVIARPISLALDNTPSLPVFQHVIKYLEDNEQYDPDIIIILQPTSPLRTVCDVEGALNKYLESRCDSMVSVCRAEHPPYLMFTIEDNKMKPIIQNREKITRRQDAPIVYRLNGAIYIAKKDFIMSENKIMDENTIAFEMPVERSVDIDNQIDLEFAEFLSKKH
jgi:CMP-N,N'-diacetyllegionaminic acid synthase